MYERMLDKKHEPTYEEFISHLGITKALFEQLDSYLSLDLETEKQLRFPYGNKYGWGMKYFIKRRHICDIFAEKDAFSVMLRLTNKQFLDVRSGVSEYTKQFIDNKYPCGDGGWIHYRVLSPENLQDIIVMLRLKAGR